MSRTVNLKIAASGALLLAHPSAKPGPEHLVYAITSVPADVPPEQVARQVSRVCLLHQHSDVAAWSYEWADVAAWSYEWADVAAWSYEWADVAAWSYEWAELAHLPQGAIINRYRSAA